MSKKDLLDILYAERARLTSEYTRPGWTNWAIFAAIASIIWLMLPYVEDGLFRAQNVILLVFCYFNVLLLLAVPLSIKIKGRAVWKKGGAINRVSASFIIVLCSSEIAFIYLADCVVVNATVIVATVMLSLLVVVYAMVFVMSFVACGITTKNNKYNWIWYILLSPVVAVLIAAIIRSWGSVSWIDFRVSLLLTVLIFLGMSINPGTREKLKGVDELIEDTLLKANPNEEYVLRKLDECVRGLRVGDYLYTEYSDSLIRSRSTLVDNLAALNEANKQENWQRSDAIITASLKKVYFIQSSIHLSMKIINSMFGSKLDETDLGLQMTVDLFFDCLDIAQVWLDIASRKGNVGEYGEYLEAVLKKYQNLSNKNEVVKQK